MTSEQIKILTFINDNKKILEELLTTLPKEKQVKDLEIRESISFAGISWSKFAEDSEGNDYMLADENTENAEFGDTNDWKNSPIRKKLNDELCQKIVDELGADALVTIQTDLFSHDGLRDYGKCDDMVSLLTYDLYRNNRSNIKNNGEWYWTCTPDSTLSGSNASYVRYVDSDGNVNYDDCIWGDGGVRPFCILKSSIFVSCQETKE